jgi:hypothetical protein
MIKGQNDQSLLSYYKGHQRAFQNHGSEHILQEVKQLATFKVPALLLGLVAFGSVRVC